MKSSPWARGVVGVALATLLVAGCESKADRRERMAEARQSIPPMAANDTFFDGRVVAHLTLGSGGGEGAGPDGGNGGGGGGRHGGGGGHHGGMGGGRRGGGGGSDDSSNSGEVAHQAHHNESIMPAALLRLRLENTSTAAVVVQIRDLNSELGDFAVRPDTLSLAPGQSVEPDGMESLLGVDSFELPVTLTLRVGEKTETKVLILKPVPLPPAPRVSPGTPPTPKFSESPTLPPPGS
ncbi:MAG: hypothetical protein ABI222_07470 [Opitutaceae bacterium]